MVEGLFETQFAFKKIMSDRKTGHSPLNVENNRRVTNDIMFAYAHEKISILLSVLSILFFWFFLVFFLFVFFFFFFFCFMILT